MTASDSNMKTDSSGMIPASPLDRQVSHNDCIRFGKRPDQWQ